MKISEDSEEQFAICIFLLSQKKIVIRPNGVCFQMVISRIAPLNLEVYRSHVEVTAYNTCVYLFVEI